MGHFAPAFPMPNPQAFLGFAPSGGPTAMTQQKRWATGLLEVLLSKDCPILATLFAKLHWRQCLAYLWIFTWGLRSIPELCYAFLPTYCIITNSHFLPKVPSHAFYSFYVHLSSLISFQKKKKKKKKREEKEKVV